MASRKEPVQAAARRLSVLHTRRGAGGDAGQVGQHHSNIPVTRKGCSPSLSKTRPSKIFEKLREQRFLRDQWGNFFF